MKTDPRIETILNVFGLRAENAGVCVGPNRWRGDGPMIESVNPANEMAVWAWNAMLAAVCGNAIVWKPSPKTPLSALAVQTLANRIIETLDLPPIFVLCVCDNALASKLVADPRVSLVSFTGSSDVGREVATKL